MKIEVLIIVPAQIIMTALFFPLCQIIALLQADDGSFQILNRKTGGRKTG